MVEYIQVPDLNDSFSRVILGRQEYLIRFTYNGAYDYWTFGLYSMGKDILLQHRKIVPLSPLTHFDVSERIPQGIFGCLTKLPRVGLNDFREKNAEFAFIPWSDLEEWREENELVR